MPPAPRARRPPPPLPKVAALPTCCTAKTTAGLRSAETECDYFGEVRHDVARQGGLPSPLRVTVVSPATTLWRARHVRDGRVALLRGRRRDMPVHQGDGLGELHERGERGLGGLLLVGRELHAAGTDRLGRRRQHRPRRQEPADVVRVANRPTPGAGLHHVALTVVADVHSVHGTTT